MENWTPKNSFKGLSLYLFSNINLLFVDYKNWFLLDILEILTPVGLYSAQKYGIRMEYVNPQVQILR